MVGDLITFAVGYLVLMVGVALCTVSGHTYLGRRVRFERRSRAIGIFETSWASALLIGAPVAALLITRFGWRGPFVVFSALAVVAAGMLWSASDTSELLADAVVDDRAVKPRLTVRAWLTIAASAAIAITGLTTVVIAGTWLDEAFGLSTEGVGLIAMAFGGAELLASTSSAAIADRAGPGRSTRVALVLVVIGLVVMTQAGGSLPVGALGLFLFFVGFEFAIVTSFAIASEAMPSARGRVLAVNTAVGTVVRGFGVAMSGVLYAAYGISGPALLSVGTAVIAFVLLVLVGRRPA
jgi:predicted MFS family arabinose efflux permease